MPEPLPIAVEMPTHLQDILRQLQALTKDQRHMHQVLEQLSRGQAAAACKAESIHGHVVDISRRLCTSAEGMNQSGSPRHPTLMPADDSIAPERFRSGKSNDSISAVPLEASLSALALPARWPASIGLRASFEIQPSECSRVTELHREMLARTRSDDHLWPTQSSLESSMRVHWNNVSHCGIHFRAISPNNPCRMSFELAGFVILLLDLSLMPYVLAWDVATETWYQVVSLLMSLFWTTDMVVTFFSGIYQDGELQLDLHVIARNYARTWLAFDLAIVLCDWSSLLILVELETEGLESVKILRFLKFSRVLRGAGVLRMVRMARIIGDYLDRTLTEGSRLLLKFVSAFFTVLFVNHIVCCAFWAIGTGAQTDTGLRWVTTPLPGGFMYEEMSTLFQYTTAVLAQL